MEFSAYTPWLFIASVFVFVVCWGLFGADIKPQMHHMTNVSVPEMMQRLKWMKSQGVEWLVLETTSHALAQNRVWGVPYSVAVLTNITHEHLAYHRTFERYRDAKRNPPQHSRSFHKWLSRHTALITPKL